MFSVTTKAADNGSTLDANSSAHETGSEAPAFVTEQSVTSFAAMAAVVQLIWQSFQNGAGSWADSVWETISCVMWSVSTANSAPRST